MVRIIKDAVAALAAATALLLLIGEQPDGNLASLAAAKIAGAALLYAAAKVMERNHPEWKEDDV